jgi:RNA polymerase sigma factor (sigma-70 family)
MFSTPGASAGPASLKGGGLVTEKAESAPSSSVDEMSELYRRYAVWLRARLSARFGAQAADDLVQEAYLRIEPYKARGIRSPKSLLLRIASNLALDGLARDATRRRNSQSVVSHSDSFDSPHEALLLKQIIRSIPEKDREVFLLSRFGGLTHAQIAATTRSCGQNRRVAHGASPETLRRPSAPLI